MEEYRSKIKSNYEQTELHQKELQLLKQVTAEQLSLFLNAELQRAQDTPLPPLQAEGAEAREELQAEVREGLQSELVQEEVGLVLRYRELGVQVARKPVRKVQCE